MRIKQLLQRVKGTDLIIGTFILLLILLRLPSVFEPHWHSGEGSFASVANALDNGTLLYKDIWTDKSPTTFIIYYFAKYAQDLNLVFIKIISLIFSIATLILTYKLANKLLSKKVALVTSFTFAILLGLPIIEANSANSENFFVFFTILGIYLCLSNKTYKYLLAGLSFGVATQFCIRPFFEIFAVILYLAIVNAKSGKIKLFVKNTSLIGIGFALIWLPVLGYFQNKGILDDFLCTIFTSDNIHSSTDNSLGFIIFQNTLLARTIITTLILIFSTSIYLKDKIKNAHFLISLWGSLVVFSILFSQKTQPHYLIQAVPVFAIATGLLVRRLIRERNITQKIQSLVLYLLILFFSISLFTHGRAFPQTIRAGNYYINFYKYLSGKMDTVAYTKSFSEDTYYSYRLNSFLKQNFSSEKDVYVWTANPWIYYLSDLESPVRYLQSYEAAKNWNEVKTSLTENPPALIIIDRTSQNPNELIKFLEENDYQFERNLEDYRIYSYKIE